MLRKRLVIFMWLFICSTKLSYGVLNTTSISFQAYFEFEAYSILDLSGIKNYTNTIQVSSLYCSTRCLNINTCYHYDTCEVDNKNWCISYEGSDIKPPISTLGNCRRFKLVQICEKESTSDCGCVSGLTGPRCNEQITTLSPAAGSLVTSSSNQYVEDCQGNKVVFVAFYYYTFNTEVAGEMKELYCEVSRHGGGIVIQRRVDNTTDFFRNWTQYENGFGDINNNFYLGNKFIHNLTNMGSTSLRVSLQDDDLEWRHAQYRTFSVGDEDSDYLLNIGDYFGTAGDSMISKHNGRKFSTFDKDNSDSNCSLKYKGGWWYSLCHHANLNGVYGSTEYGVGINWLSWHGHNYSMKTTKMKISYT